MKLRMKAHIKTRPPLQYRTQRCRDRSLAGEIAALHEILTREIKLRVGDRVWLLLVQAGILLSKYPRGPRPAYGRISTRLRRARICRGRIRRHGGVG